MKITGIFVSVLSFLLLSGCNKPNVESGATVTSTPAVVATAGETTSTPPAVATSETPSSQAIPATYSLDPSTAELTDGITKVADQKGRADQGLAFTGEGTKLELPWDINTEKYPQLTITAWARFTGNVEERAQYQVVSHDDGNFDRGLGIDARAGEWGWSAFAGDAGVIGGVPLVANEWVFLAITYDQEGGASRLTVRDTQLSPIESKLGTGHPHVWIGGNPSFGEHFVGDIAHVQIFDRVLTDDEIKAVKDQ